MQKRTIFTIILSISLAACAPIIPESGSGAPTPVVMTAVVSTVVPSTIGPLPTQGASPTLTPATPIPTLPASMLSPTELKYKLLDQFPDFFFCDPDLYPVARDDEMVLAQQRFPELQANQEEFQAILNHNGLAGTTTFTDDQKVLIYREHKKLNAVHFDLAGAQYQFQIQTGKDGQQGSIVTGTVDRNGSIVIKNQESSIVSCPICLAAGTRIDTPRGAVAVENLRVGDPVWTTNEAGERVAATISRTSRLPVPPSHQVVHVMLSDGRELWASPSHPTADGRLLGDLQVNDLLDGAYVISVERLPYGGTATYDILPSGDTGFYWAEGILMGSTLADR
ncbi:MAG TPA: Hint domain-containing protein [Anaerolineales bacterium]|nr:Hint domain-containing protein [Anaerolineales bacterium]